MFQDHHRGFFMVDIFGKMLEEINGFRGHLIVVVQ